MFSLLSSTVDLSRVGISKLSLFSWPAWRFFSQSAQYAGPEDPIARREWLDKRSELQRARYHANVAKARRTAREWRQSQRVNNPAAYKVWCQKNSVASARSQATNPKWKFLQRLHFWCLHYSWVRDELPWETHVPVVYPEKVHKQCFGCDRLKKGGGVRLWWERLCYIVSTEQTNHVPRWKLRSDKNQADQEQYLCNACYVGEDTWQHALPKGYEDVRYLKELAARKKELDGVNHGRQTVEDTKSK